jgi:hypothetical protein
MATVEIFVATSIRRGGYGLVPLRVVSFLRWREVVVFANQ